MIARYLVAAVVAAAAPAMAQIETFELLPTPASGHFRDYVISAVGGTLEFATVSGLDVNVRYEYDPSVPDIFFYSIENDVDCDSLGGHCSYDFRRMVTTPTQFFFSVYVPASFDRCDIAKAAYADYGDLCASYSDLLYGQAYITSSDGSTATLQVLREGAVPEPASWALMIAGFGMTGAALRRRHYRTA
ncbi:PEPxxWA-CTERM sorting domain-containing protein [Polymorphobacter arshaanensis]|uniref:PEPxxWA-CTERM sorting domain-containing protein n=1 Tax=Glacieibacterium arshaanense TaxID=2511025 RepID=UPI001FB12A75|nr:PEPxxWA-CTERM sorting domain-containing protein [Polymorphobacter arshaanensis]